MTEKDVLEVVKQAARKDMDGIIEAFAKVVKNIDNLTQVALTSPYCCTRFGEVIWQRGKTKVL